MTVTPCGLVLYCSSSAAQVQPAPHTRSSRGPRSEPGAPPHAEGISQLSLSNDDVSAIGELEEQGDDSAIGEPREQENVTAIGESAEQGDVSVIGEPGGTRRRFGDR